MTLRFQAASLGGVWLDQSFAPGISHVLGAWEDGAERLWQLATGCMKPSSGVVTLDGLPLFNRPELRAAVGSLHRLEDGLAAGKVVEVLQRLCRLRGSAACWEPRESLERLGLGALADKPLFSLSNAEKRGVALAHALGLKVPRALVLVEPLSIPGVERQAVIDSLRALGASIPVLTLGSKLDDAIVLGADVYSMRGFRLVNGPTRSSALLHPHGAAYRVTTNASPELVQALLREPAIQNVHSPDHKHTLQVTGSDPIATSLAILRAAHTSGASVFTLSELSEGGSASQPHAGQTATPDGARG